ncbi:MAG: prepilin-type N-terminal cleavage/methylation domain-containing protein [Candidatus Roizmanbacteria bacterium]|nr:prepilin-type N-terminal cleavage/methylation domain-containing protein [Candidatus Roizmanbacteria bacterium]
MSKNKGFTLIELLVVVGIIAILAIAALIAINPLEAQRRSRDSARLQDMARLTSVIEAYINDQGYATLADGTTAAAALTGIRSQNCAANAHWLDPAGGTAMDLCPYIKQVPLDPLNNRATSALDGTGTQAAPGRTSRVTHYSFDVDVNTGNYEFCTILESDINWPTIVNDSGNANGFFEAGVRTNLQNCT